MRDSNRTLGEQWADALLNAAQAKGEAMRARKLAERVQDRIFLAEQGSIELRKAKARTHERYISADDAAIDAEHTALLAKASADAAEALFAEWQSRNATARAEMQLR